MARSVLAGEDKNKFVMKKDISQQSYRSKTVLRLVFTCSNLTIETQEKGVKYVQSQ